MNPTILTLGTAQLGLAYGIANQQGMLAEQDAFAILDAAIEHGICSLDTAPAYGEAEARIGAWLRERGSPSLVVTTKLNGLPPDIAAAEIGRFVRGEIEGSLRRLRLTRVDHLLLHRPGDLRSHPGVLADGLQAVVDAGLVGAVGISWLAPEDAQSFLADDRMTSIQVPLNLLDRRTHHDGLLSALGRRGAVVFARSPFLQGALSMDPNRLPARAAHLAPWLERVQGIAIEHGGTAASFALAWCARQPGVSSVVAGALDVDQVKANATAVHIAIPPAFERAIAALEQPPREVIDPSQWQ